MSALDDLRQQLLDGRNPDGGWGYYRGKVSRLEPTCWALLALGANEAPPSDAFLVGRQRPDGWLAEDSTWPINIGFNALAALVWTAHPQLAGTDRRRRLLDALATSKGIKAPPGNSSQDNSLQGWSWIDGTFSWVEPTGWGLLALKRARRAGLDIAGAPARIAEAERLLVNRTCRGGGWNFGNAAVMQQDLRAYVPTTALALLAMADRAGERAVQESRSFLSRQWDSERSSLAMSLSLVCLDQMTSVADGVESALQNHVPAALAFGNFHLLGMTRFALASRGREHAFTL
jgi:hypothetical protein